MIDPQHLRSLAALWMIVCRRLKVIDRWFFSRALGHATLFVLLLVALSFSLPKSVGPTVYANNLLNPQSTTPSLLYIRFASPLQQERYLQQSVLPFTSRRVGDILPIAEAERTIRTEVLTYTVQKNDTIEVIAVRFNVKVTTLMYSNPEVYLYPDALSIGQEILIPPVDGAIHIVGEGDNIQSIANAYQVTTQIIADFVSNKLSPPYVLVPGQMLVLPGGIKPAPPKPKPEPEPEPEPEYVYESPKASTGSGYLEWPASGLITQDCYNYHIALDIANKSGTPIYAADAGYVFRIESLNYSWGHYILIDHGNGMVTRYAHLSGFNVVVGQSVAKGELIGFMGTTGKSTGNHLHFEVIINGQQVCPWGYLPG
ncbi:MAG: peptidoglycan DD-metalloendopeptidase family protein [Anaerolineae bacterium]